MRFLNLILIKLFSLRTLVAVAAFWVLIRGPVPEWFQEMQEQVQGQLFDLGMRLSDLPSPQTFITVIHVSDIEYQRWTVDLPGAESLQRILQAGDEQTMFGLVLEQPLVLLQPAAESVLHDIQQNRRSRDVRYKEANALLARRDELVTALKSPRLVLGLTDQSSHFYRRIPVRESFLDYPQPLRDWLWPWPDAPGATVVSPGFQYFPIDSAPHQQQRLALLEDGQVVPMFSLQFWAAASRLAGAAAARDPHVLHWQRDEGFVLGVEQIATSTRADIVPLYGANSGIRASMKQITLHAALTAGPLSGWVLLGRDGSAVLEKAAQTIAALGDRAFLYEPPWWSAAHRGLLALLIVFLVGLVPYLQWRWVIGLTASGIALVTTTQVVGQVIAGWWLPGGDLVLLGIGGVLVMLIWRGQQHAWRHLQRRLDSAQLALAEFYIAHNQLLEAWQNVRACRNSEQVLECLYRIAELQELAGDYSLSLAVLQDLARRKRHYRDVPTRIKRLKACLLYKQEAAAPTPTTATESLPSQ